MILHMHTIIIICIGSGIDFNTDPFTIKIDTGATIGRANISVTCDDVAEELETFDMRLALTSSISGITLGRDMAKGQITDSTGKLNSRLIIVF